MGECCGGEEEHSESYDPSNKGPNSNRRCTDVLCLGLLFVFLGAWTGVGVYSFSFGNPSQLIYPSNSEGQICGRGAYAEKPYLLFFDLSRCARLSSALSGCPTPQVCVSSCPNTYWSYHQGKSPEVEQFCTGLNSGEFQQASNISHLVKQRKCPGYLLNSTVVLGRCVPNFGLDSSKNAPGTPTAAPSSEEIEKAKEGKKYLWESLKLRSYGEKLLADLALDWWVLLVALLLACILSFLWIVLMRLAAGPIIWITIILSVLVLLGVTGFSFYKYFEKRENQRSGSIDDIFVAPGIDQIVNHYFDQDTWLTIGIVMAIISLVIILVLLFLSKRITIAVKLIEEASKAVGQNMTTLVFPVFPFLLQSLIVGWFLIVASCLITAGEKEYKVVDTYDCVSCLNQDTNSTFESGDICNPETFNCPSCPDAQCVFEKYGPDIINRGLQIMNFVGLFWLLFFFGAMGEMVMAGAFSGWYWTRDKTDTSNSGLGASFGRTCRYHLGTLAFGSLILTGIRMIRVILEWVEERLKRAGVADNAGVKCVMCFCKCCMWCLEKFIKYMNRNAYIMTAIYGYGFCKAGRKSFELLVKNAVRAGTLDRVTDFILFLGKIIVVAAVTILTYFLLEQNDSLFMAKELNYKWVPIFMVMVGTYAIASCFFSVYSMAVDTIFLCFLEDLDRHQGGPYFMGKDLKKILDLKEYRDPKVEIPLMPQGGEAL